MTNGMIKRGASRAFAGVLFGERAALPHGGASERKLKPDEFVLVDNSSAQKILDNLQINTTIFYI